MSQKSNKAISTTPRNNKRIASICLFATTCAILFTITNIHLQSEFQIALTGQRSLYTSIAATEKNSTIVDRNKEVKQTDTTNTDTKDSSIMIKSFNRTNPHSRTWCPNTKCHNSPLCTPCNKRYLFIIATGRSGSTTLLHMFNALPNVRLSGENWNILYHASHLRKVFNNNPKNFIKKETMAKGRYMHEAVESGPFIHNAIPMGSFSCVVQKLLEYLNPPSIHPVHSYIENEEEEKRLITGAKMIRLQTANWTSVGAYQFLRESFPCARYIINIRSDFEGQAKSVATAFGDDSNPSEEERDTILQDIQQETNFLRELAHRFGDEKAKLLDMDDWKDNVSILNEVLNWLGFKNCAFDKIVHENHDNYGHDDQNIHVGDECQYPHA